jgi:hypothetical protein
MLSYVVFDENDTFQNIIICDDSFQLPIGWRKELVPEGYVWYTDRFVTYEERQSLFSKNI